MLLSTAVVLSWGLMATAGDRAFDAPDAPEPWDPPQSFRVVQPASAYGAATERDEHDAIADDEIVDGEYEIVEPPRRVGTEPFTRLSQLPRRGAEPEPLDADAVDVSPLVADIQDPQVDMQIIMRRSKLLRTRKLVTRIAIADPELIEVVQFSPREMEIIGRRTGTTTLTLWFQPDRPDQTGQVLRYLVTVTRDTAVDRQRWLEYGELERMINEMFPGSMVQLIPLADKLVVRGQARDAEEATQIMSIIRTEAFNFVGGAGSGGGRLFVAQGPAAEPFPDASQLPASTVISMLEVPGEMQVLLKVRIAELKRSALRELGVDFTVNPDNFFLSSIISGASNIVGIFDGANFSTFFHAFTSNGTMKILAEPNLVTLSGYTASFIAGGEFAVPTVVGVDGVQAATTQFRGFGTQLTFTPTVLDKDRIRLQVAPEFSAINNGIAVNGIPGLNTRAAVTTVDLREGQWLAIAGLLQDQQNGTNGRVPLLGDIPLVGVIFSNKSISRDETELIVLVSPELVHAMDPKELPPLLPGTDVTEPGDLAFYVGGRVEGLENCDHRSTVWPLYRSNTKLLRHSRFLGSMGYYTANSCGFSD